MESPNVYVIAGPNGAGKTTFADRFLPHFVATRHFVNADSIAAGLSPFSPDLVTMQAGRLMLERIDDLARQGVDFGFETTFSGKSMARRIMRMRQASHCVHMTYLWVDGPDLAVARVADRVRRGGHNVPDDVVRRRYFAGLHNLFDCYLPLAHYWIIYDNSGLEPVRIARGDPDGSQIDDAERYHEIERIAGL